jgi:hypothetical protein
VGIVHPADLASIVENACLKTMIRAKNPGNQKAGCGDDFAIQPGIQASATPGFMPPFSVDGHVPVDRRSTNQADTGA